MSMQAQRGGRGIAPSHLQPGTRKSWWSAPLYPWGRPITHCTGGCVALRAHLDGTENLAPTGFHPWTIQAIASHCIDYAILATNSNLYVTHICKGTCIPSVHSCPNKVFQRCSGSFVKCFGRKLIEAENTFCID